MVWCTAIILGVILFIAGCTNVEGRSGRIIGGDSVFIVNYPYQVSLRDATGYHFCGGSIISERHILTAAHCISNDEDSPLGFHHVQVFTGTSYSMENAGNPHSITKIEVHPGWVNITRGSKDWPSPNDIAVITLKEKIVFDKYQQKIDLPSHNFEEGHLANVTGWGMTSQVPDWSWLNQLQMIETKLVSREECRKKMSNPERKVYDTHVCALHSRGHGACYGDSGGPLAVNGQLVGIASWIDGKNCAVGYPDVFTNVYKFKDFIENIMKNSE